jgi:hypothetical protein
MKTLFLASCLLFLFISNSQSQWFVRKYDVTDINYLSKGQLDLSLTKSKSNLHISEFFTGLGGGIFLIFKCSHTEYIGTLTGAGVMAGGAVASFGYLVRIGKIKAAIKRNFPVSGALRVTPALISNKNERTGSPGITITYNF